MSKFSARSKLHIIALDILENNPDLLINFKFKHVNYFGHPRTYSFDRFNSDFYAVLKQEGTLEEIERFEEVIIMQKLSGES